MCQPWHPKTSTDECLYTDKQWTDSRHETAVQTTFNSCTDGQRGKRVDSDALCIHGLIPLVGHG